MAELFTDAKFRRLTELLQGMDRALVAYSGGVDSTFLLKIARDVLGDKVEGVLAVSESLDRNESRSAVRTAETIGVPIRLIETEEYEREEYRRNGPDRCYHCKTELFSRLRQLAAEEGVPYVLDGSNADDLRDYRPGLRARTEQGVRSPLAEVGLTKSDIRAFSHALDLPTWDKPAAPCLSSRIPYGFRVTSAKLRQVEEAEAALRVLGFAVVRVRHHDTVARIEVPVEEFSRLLESDTRAEVIRRVKAAGFTFVSLDIQGFRSGGLNEVLGEARG